MVNPVAAGIVVSFLAEKVLGTALQKYTEGAIEKINSLWARVWDKLRGNPKAEQARQALEEQKDLSAKGNLERYLLNAMEDDPEFQALVEELAQEIKAAEKEDSGNMTQIVRDQATGYQTKVTGGTAFIGGQHKHGQS